MQIIKNIFILILCVLMTSISVYSQGKLKTIHFSGQEWYVKNKANLFGPGRNYWSDSEESVWVDDRGYLHLKIRYDQVSDKWLCAEIWSKNEISLGEHIFEIQYDLDHQDPNVVLGVFLRNNSTYTEPREVTVEFAQWGDPTHPNTSFSLHTDDERPAEWYHEIESTIGNNHNFYSSINWQSDNILFNVVKGSYLSHDERDIKSFHYRKELGSDYRQDYIPKQNEKLKVHINYWLNDLDKDKKGDPPINNEECHVIIKSYSVN